jgi:isopenicillin N synthase-like dioxygenase
MVLVVIITHKVKPPASDFIDVVPVPDTIIVNTGDLLQRWTDGVIKSTVLCLTIN